LPFTLKISSQNQPLAQAGQAQAAINTVVLSGHPAAHELGFSPMPQLVKTPTIGENTNW
jgi:pyridoxal/pyridoxine/pyridoxamine kinase